MAKFSKDGLISERIFSLVPFSKKFCWKLEGQWFGYFIFEDGTKLKIPFEISPPLNCSIDLGEY